MSGRVRTTLADGRRVTGFRKTLKRRERIPPHLRPDWSLAIRRNDFGLLLLPTGPTNTIGVRVYADGIIEARGKNRAWVIDQMTAFLAGLGIVTDLPRPKRLAQPAVAQITPAV